MTWLYSSEETERRAASARAFRLAAWIVGGTALAVCMALCCLVTTGNAARVFRAVVAVSAVGGWAVILLLRLGYFPASAEARHAEGILNGPRETLEGRLTVSDRAFTIPKSVRVRAARIEQGERAVPAQVDERLAGWLPENGAEVRLITVHGFIAAYEVRHE